MAKVSQGTKAVAAYRLLSRLPYWLLFATSRKAQTMAQEKVLMSLEKDLTHRLAGYKKKHALEKRKGDVFSCCGGDSIFFWLLLNCSYI
jgi:hypothetical protein